MFELIVFVSGALIMVLEMVGSRVLAPYLGTSLIVWTSLIGVVLAFLAVGAWCGGRLADRHLSPRRLAWILACAGGGTVLTAVLHPFVGRLVATNVQGLHIATLTATVLLLSLPALFFGMVSPYVIRLRISDLKTSGQTVGRLYALSTAGSIAGTFMGGFVLISWFSTTQILFGVAAGMLVLSLLAWGSKPVVRGGLIVLLLAAGALYKPAFVSADYLRNPLLVETPYNSITVAEGYLEGPARPMRLLITDPGSCQSGIYLDAPNELALAYTRFYALGPAFNPQGSRVLMLGGGGYSVPRWLLSNQSGLDPAKLTVDVVEIDPGMTRVAREHFGIPDDPRLTIHHQDARAFLNTNKTAYDLIFVDVFGSYYSIPFQMGTVEAMAELRRALAPGGVVVMNAISALDGERGQILHALFGAMKTAFPEVHVFAVRNPRSREVQNVMLMAFADHDPAREATLAQTPPDVRGDARTLPHMLARRVPITPSVPPLTDAFAPVEWYMLSLVESSR